MFEILRPLDASSAKENGEFANQKPFEFRGHHLLHFFYLNNHSPEIVAAVMTGTSFNRYIEAEKNPDHPEAQKHRDYALDIFGPSLEHMQNYLDFTKHVFEIYLILHNAYPAEITEGIPDVMCGACAIAKHCKKLNQDNLSGEGTKNVLVTDGKYIEKFIESLDNLNLPKPVISQDLAFFSDAEPKMIRRIKTTIGTVRDVLSQTELEFWKK